MVIKTCSELKNWLVDKEKSFALDTETTSLNYLDMQLVGISLYNGVKACYIDLFENSELTNILGVLNSWLQSLELIVLHNAPFDLKVLSKYGFNLEDKKIFDTLIASHLLDENMPHGLKHLAALYLNIPSHTYLGYEDIVKYGYHSEQFYNYAERDALWTYQLYKLFQPRIEQEGLHYLFYNIEMPFMFCLVEMETKGVLIDKNKLEKLRQELVLQIETLQIKLCKLADIDCFFQKRFFDSEDNKRGLITEINIDSPQQLLKLLREKFHFDIDSVAKQTLDNLEENEFIKVLREYRKAAALRDKFIEVLPDFVDYDGRVRTSFRNTLATGRLASSNPNLQQLPRDNTGPLKVRECIIAPPGKSLICLDYSGQELRVTAEESQDKAMINAFQNEQDLHQMVADECKISRDAAKAVNFGIIYGMTYKGLSKRLKISDEEAKIFIDKYFEKFPRIKDRIDRCKHDIWVQQWVSNLIGRRRRFPDYEKIQSVVKARAERQAFNFLIQSFSADMMKLGAIRIRELCKQYPQWDCILVLAVHDEYLLEIKDEYVQEAIPLIKNVIESSMRLTVPIKVDVGFAKNYSEAKK